MLSRRHTSTISRGPGYFTAETESHSYFTDPSHCLSVTYLLLEVRLATSSWYPDEIRLTLALLACELCEQHTSLRICPDAWYSTLLYQGQCEDCRGDGEHVESMHGVKVSHEV